MSNLIELRNSKTKLLLDAQKILTKQGVTAEERTSAQKMIADVDAIEQNIALEERIAKDTAERAEQEQRAARPPRGQVGVAPTNETREAEKRAFTDYLKFGKADMTVLKENRDLSTGNAGITIAQDYLGQLIEGQKAWGQLTLAVGQKRTQNGEPLRIPMVNDVSSVSTVIGESVTGTPVIAPELDPTFAGFINNVSFMSTGEVKISLAELQDSYFDLDSWIRTAFGKRMARGLSAAIVNGTSDTNFQSIITTAGTGITSGAPATLSYADFVGLYAKLDPAFTQTSSYIFNSTTRGLILGLTDTLGRPLFVPSVNTDSLDTILGRPVVISQSHPNVAAGVVGAVQFGSLEDAYVLRSAGSLSVLRLNERYADTGQVAFIGYHRNSGYSIAVSGSPAPLINLTQHV
jgi:HK97 family phage major capsid protein